ncbi:TetR/AcrR family transcriptional regulator [Rhizobium sp. BE258]|uniref:TetR/AcrR family transcriptional regulator n=1 Tax=Rhizobium sp. BE258 TaxID=2817722 RepID=UPI000DD7A98C|nr:TetR/AcrR family transcriptional regulator [Rhizobium sp. BE258]MDR7144979.1 AcrR family transcriptional regulator [Rhizobium sp. BE258]
MRYVKDQKAQSRADILAAASRRFRADGIAASGIAGIMHDANKTNGAFYAHFSSKDDLVCEVLNDALERQAQEISDTSVNANLKTALSRYLSTAHRDHPADGCPSAALLPEIARQPQSTRLAYEEHLREILARLADGINGNDSGMIKAAAVFSMAVGALQLARAVPSEELAEMLLESARAGADLLLNG